MMVVFFVREFPWCFGLQLLFICSVECFFDLRFHEIFWVAVLFCNDSDKLKLLVQ